jgi:hypothetical protein
VLIRHPLCIQRQSRFVACLLDSLQCRHGRTEAERTSVEELVVVPSRECLRDAVEFRCSRTDYVIRRRVPRKTFFELDAAVLAAFRRGRSSVREELQSVCVAVIVISSY